MRWRRSAARCTACSDCGTTPGTSLRVPGSTRTDHVSRFRLVQRCHLRLRRLDDEICTRLLAEEPCVEDEIVLMHVAWPTVEVRIEEVGPAMVALADLLGRFLFRHPLRLAHVGDALGQRSDDADIKRRRSRQ